MRISQLVLYYVALTLTKNNLINFHYVPYKFVLFIIHISKMPGVENIADNTPLSDELFIRMLYFSRALMPTSCGLE